MVATNLKSETMKLMDRRSEMEAEMNLIIHRLCQNGGPGISGKLINSEGFPMADIDVHTVRVDRNRLAVIRNDHKDITERINQSIQLLHSAKLEPSSVTDSASNVRDVNTGTSLSFSNPTAGDTSIAMDVDLVSRRPFAMVDEITESSPAADDGLQLGDQIVKFGNVEIGENLSQKLAAEAQKNQDHAVHMIVMRQGDIVNVTVTPRAWSGRGLLGCHFRIL